MDLFEIPLIIPDKLRRRHIYIIGKSGFGKTTLLQWMIMRDIKEGRGVALLNPDRDVIEQDILPFIPPNRIKDIIYFDPTDLAHPISMNPLSAEPGEDIDIKVDELSTILQGIMDGVSVRMQTIMSNALYALCSVPGTTLLDFDRFLDRDNIAFRKRILSKIDNDQVRHFFNSTYEQMPKDAHVPLVYRLNDFMRSKYLRYTLCNKSNSLNFRKVMDEGRILLCNVSDGGIGPEGASMLGKIIVAKLQLAAMSRQDTPEKERRQFYLYVDEFQKFVSSSGRFQEIFSRARKYGLGLVVAHQNTSQIKTILNEVLGNTAVQIAFNIAALDAAKLSRNFTLENDGDKFVQPDNFMKLGIGQAYVRIGNDSYLVKTPKLNDEPNWYFKDKIIQHSQQRWGSPVEEVKEDRAKQRPVKKKEPKALPPGTLDSDDPFGEDPGDIFG